MWDLIVSVPNHCLSFYFDLGSFSNQYTSSFDIFVVFEFDTGCHLRFLKLYVNEQSLLAV